MPDPLDLEPIKARYAGVSRTRRENDPQVQEALALIAEVERLRDERGFWREATHHLSERRQEDAPPA